MTTLLEYKGYVGKVEVDLDANILHGEVMYLRDVVTFQGKTVDDIRQAFQDSIEDYLEFCESEGEEPEKPFSGKFLVRLTAEQHKLVTIAAMSAGSSLNAWVSEHLARDAEKELNERGISTKNYRLNQLGV
ncbi:type II toxin-antitoxin system HicB family antitoxin [Cohnella phaseoli]|uniref:Putative HicB family RNase H-like nuclease n=1 Tax=Cohnella phaseoli TaxID=456490 RepID=A0A3D9JMV7_9BACL|nr:type II toxin-antitoxin system HicB family antitoxin [Cohnella phaseoli]RED75402.1 putative HicB family RNase H-like nuclease [Cohnella phaseoli]